MLKSIQQRDQKGNRWIKITMTVILGLICLSMVLYLIPGLMSGNLTASSSPDALATVGGQDVSLADAQQQLDLAAESQSIPAMLRPIYAKQIADQMIFSSALELEANRLGITVTPQEERARIKQILPMSFAGDTWLKDRYASDVENNLHITVPQFESELRDSMIQEKFRQLVTSGITVSDAEIQQEFQARNEKVQIQYALIKPADLTSIIHPTDAELAAYFAKNAAKYQVPEKRVARYALLDLDQLKATMQVTDPELQAYYNANLDQYKVENRAHVEHILFKTVGKTDAEIAEIRQKAEDVLKQAKSGANFEDLAKKNSEDDATKDKGGDLGWIVDGQTAPQFQEAAFSIPVGSVSDLIQTAYGIEIIKVLDRETAHTKSFDEVKDSIQPIVLENKVNAEADDVSNQLDASIRQSDHQSLDSLAKKFNMQVAESAPVTFSQPIDDLGDSSDLHRLLFELQPGEVGEPLRIDKGVVVLTVASIQPEHQGTLAEVHDQVLAEYQHEQATQLAASRASDLAKQAQSGQDFTKVAKTLGLNANTSDFFARSGSIPDVGTGKQIQGAFTLPVGKVSSAINLSGNWLVFKVVTRNEPNPDDLAAQREEIRQQLLQTKQDAAFEAFHTSLEDELEKEGKLVIHGDVLASFTKSAT
ncbi:MAG TPA: peptidyl-prolyl cis-trans isomerase [Candidatus Aquilonibacter sp.]|nr:peptidyl-prolyl cis-trans isomerase [Candidatus Aquilonibacter sp.]